MNDYLESLIREKFPEEWTDALCEKYSEEWFLMGCKIMSNLSSTVTEIKLILTELKESLKKNYGFIESSVYLSIKNGGREVRWC